MALVAVIYSVDWGDDNDPSGKPRALSIGFDLDGRCTSLFDPPACEPAAWTDVTIIDGPNGIDNAIGLMLHDQAKAFGLKPFTSQFLSANVQMGTEAPSAMFRISGYSGFADDEQVTVEWLVPSAPTEPPKWDGSDVWAISPGTADSTSKDDVLSRYVDPGAYVTGYRLVAHFPSGPPIVISNAPIATVDTLMAADLVQPVVGRWEMHNGVLGGRAKVSEVFRDVPELSASFAGAGTAICKDTPTLYANVKRWLCGHTDTLLGKGPACDGLSFGMNFDTRPGKVGGIAPPSMATVYCTPQNDPATDSCDTAPP